MKKVISISMKALEDQIEELKKLPVELLTDNIEGVIGVLELIAEDLHPGSLGEVTLTPYRHHPNNTFANVVRR